jgi:hypothetical protein
MPCALCVAGVNQRPPPTPARTIRQTPRRCHTATSDGSGDSQSASLVPEKALLTTTTTAKLSSGVAA